MLQKIRDNTQSMIAKVFVWFIIVVFGAWGVSTIVATVINRSPAISVNGVDIDEQQVEQNTQIRIQQMIDNMGPDADLSSIDENAVREDAMTELIQRELIRQYAEKTGMVVSSRAIDRSITQNPDFQIDGVFNSERAQLLLQSMGYTPSSYRVALANQGLINQTSYAYGLSGFVTHPEIEHIASLVKQTRDLRYILIDLSDKLNTVEISDEEISNYYNDHQNEFMQEEQVSLEYLELDKDDMYDDVEVSEDEIRQRYDEEQQEYQAQIERRASHILLSASTDEEYAAAETQAAELKTRIDNGESFEDLAAEYSDDTGSAEDGGDVGYTTGDNFVEEFEQALQGLQVGEVSDPVRTDFGIHLIKLTEQSESTIESFEDARDRIERDLKTAQVDTLFIERSEELGNLAFESFDLTDPAEIMGLELMTTDLFGRSGGTGIAANGDVINQAFSPEILTDGLNSDLIAITPSRSVVIRVAEHNQPAVQPLDDVRGEIQVMLQFQRLSEQTTDLGETLTNNLKNGQNIDSMLEIQGLNWNQLNGLERTDSSLPPELIQDIFNMKVPEEGAVTIEGFPLSSGGYVVVELQQANDGSIEDFEENEINSLEEFLSQQSANADFQSLVLGMQNRADIVR